MRRLLVEGISERSRGTKITFILRIRKGNYTEGIISNCLLEKLSSARSKYLRFISVGLVKFLNKGKYFGFS